MFNYIRKAWANFMQENELDRTVPFVDAVFRIMEGTAEEAEAVHIFLQAEQRHNIKLLRPAVDSLPDAPEGVIGDALIENNFYPFLTETHLISCPYYEYEATTLMLPGGYTWGATGRAWGRMLAEWANEAHWAGKTDWNYTHFYCGYAFIVKDYERWQEAALKVIEAKCRLELTDGVTP